ncbi:hypothetical protein BDR03DRAFT_1047251 [Suillus americanus]|nr:hypothetical protein BDR03DRAFT_1047251 [Suillus americanus]
MFLREPYKGPTRKLVLAFDVGTTFSGVSYCILDPGEVPVIRGVARYPAQDSFGGNSKIPSILYYDLQGHVRAVGAEVLQEHVIEQAEDEGWVKLAWWKLHLRAKHLPSSHIRDADIEPLPQGKSAVEVLADFMRYLFQCARSYIQESHLNLWRSVENSIEFVLTHPNVWEGQQQQQIRRAVELAGLISSKEEQSHVHLLTEGEASLHFCVTNVIASDKTPLDVSDYDYSNDEEDQSGSQGVIVVDAGGGTIDLSAYSMKLSPTSFKEISPAECSLQGSVFVTSRARTLLQKKLSGSKRYSDPKIVAQMADIFDKSAKLWFRKPDEPSYIKFGTIRDKDLKYDIRSGQLKLAGFDIADLFEPSIEAIIEAVEQQRRVASTPISLICLVGGFAASDWLFVRLQEYFLPLGISFCRHDAHVNKAVADGAVSFYIDHLVSSQVARAIYGIECNALYNQDPEHPARQHKGFVDVAGRLLIPDYFQGILLKGTQVSELREFRKSFHTTRTSLAACKIESTDIMCYKCALQEPQWLDVERCMPTGGQPHVDYQKLSVPSGFQMDNSQSQGNKLTSEEQLAMSNSRSASTSSAISQFRSTMVRTPSTGGFGHPMHVNSYCTHFKRSKEHGDAEKVPMSQQGHSSGIGTAPIPGADLEPVVPLELSVNRWVPTSMTRKAQPGVDSPELVDRNVKALLNKLTMEKFETISDQIIHWANKSVNEKDGRTLVQVIRLVYEKAIDEAACNEMYARLCRKMMEQISPEVQDDGIKNTEGKPIAGGQLFRKYLLNRCQEDFERGWFPEEAIVATAAAKASDDHATKAARKTTGMNEAELCFEEYYAARKARRQGLGLIKFIGELFKLQMLTERVMHECVKKLLGNVENPVEEEIESLCQLLKTVGQLLDTPKARAHMDVYFTRMKELGKSLDVSSRMQFMLQDVIELRDRKWVSRNAVAAPTTIAAVRELAAKEKAAAEKESFNRQISMSCGRSRRGDKVSTASGKTPTPLPSQSAWAKGPPQSNSSAAPSPRSQSPAPTHVASPIAISHSRRPSALGQGVSVKDGVSVPRNNVGSVVRPASVVFGSIDDASAPLSSSPAAIPAVKTEVVKSFGSVPATSSNHVNGKTSASASATGSSKQPPRPSLSSTPSNSSALSSTAATSTASTPKPSRADIAKLFQNPSSSSSQPSSDTSSPSTRPSNLPSHHQSSSSSSQQPQQPSQLGTHSYSQFVPNNMRPPQQPSGTPRSPAFSRAVPNVQGQSRQGAGPGGPGGPPIPASPRMAPHPHQAPPGGIPPQVPMQPMSWSGYYVSTPFF